jgi:hypothetical protein
LRFARPIAAAVADVADVGAGAAPPADADVPAWWAALGVDGLYDVHVHFLPEPVLRKVWAYFDAAPTHYGVSWPVYYRLDQDARLQRLRALGVRRFPALVYPHKPGMAQWLSEWAREFAAVTPDCAVSGTFYPEPGAADYVRTALEAGTRIFKVHVQVGEFDPAGPELDAVWGQLAEAATPVVVHCGSGPLPGRHTGPGPIGAVLRRHPRLTLVIAHAGAPEYAEHLALVEQYPNVWLDTTMVGTDFMNALAPIPAETLAAYRDRGDRIVLGSDFPNIPYSYATQLAALQRWDFGDEWLRAVVHQNGKRLLGG